jgi:hypothetical protein
MSAVLDHTEALSFSSAVDKHRGKPFLVCGTGPSIDQFPKSFYEEWEGITIGVNDITELFIPNYHINIHKRPSIIRDNTEGLDLVFKYFNPSSQIDPEKSGLLSMVGTVALIALTAAYQLGASDIYLIGVDCKVSPSQHHFKGCSSVYWDKDNPYPMDAPRPDGFLMESHFIQKIDELRATIRGFERAIKLYWEHGVKTINLSNDSLIEV